jgi:hypothetical protein
MANAITSRSQLRRGAIAPCQPSYVFRSYGARAFFVYRPSINISSLRDFIRSQDSEYE